MEEVKRCPVTGHTSTSSSGTSNKDWWPNQINLKLLQQHSEKINPMNPGFNYKQEFLSMDLSKIKKDIFLKNLILQERIRHMLYII